MPLADSSAPTTEETGRASKGARAWVGRVLRPLKAQAASSSNVESDPLLAFASETEPQAPAVPVLPKQEAPTRPLRALRAAVLVPIGIAIVVTALATVGLTRLIAWRSAAAAPKTGSVTVLTRPAGAQVTIDDAPRGITPLTLSLEPGPHTVKVRLGQEERAIPVTVTTGADIVRDLEMQAATAKAVAAQMSVTTDPPGARVTIDGTHSGTSPVTVDGLAPGEHTVAVASATGSAEKKVTLTAGHMASVVFSLPKSSGPLGGWLAVSAPFEVQVQERDDVIGASGSSRIMLAAGRHDIVLVNRTLDYQEAKRIEITAGQTSQVRVDPPKVSMNVNARPWADVTIDGNEIGQTPISNATVTVGTHQLVFRHPQLGERRQSVVVTAKGPNRVSVDLTK
jgi:eukaryotic-like serine/threonine-protein kinase